MIKSKNLLFSSLVAFIMCAAFLSCKKNSVSPTPTISLSDTTKTVSESVGTVSLTVNLNEAMSTPTKLTLSFGGTAIFNGDYEVDSSSQITIPAGKTSATLNITIFDDNVVEPDETIKVTFSAPSNIRLSNSTSTITIKDNDVSNAANGLQTDLYWDAGSMVNLDLYIANNVTVSGNAITNFNLVDSSAHLTGFESATIKNSYPDGDYYVVVYYASGARAVNYTLRYNGPGGIVNDTTNASMSISDVGAAYFFGPITKNGSSYSRTSGRLFNLAAMKPYVYKGKLK